MLDVLFNMRKIRFPIIDKLISDEKIDIGNNRVNVFINMENILRHLSTERIDKYMRVKNNTKIFDLISNMINLVAHYRLYFSSRQIKSNIYLYIQYPFDTVYNNHKYNKEYREVYKFRYSENICNYIVFDNLNIAIDMTKIILEYIENAHIIVSGNIENSVIPYMLGNDNNAINFIVSTDMYDMQYAGLGYNILYPKKENSRLITKNNIVKQFSEIFGVDMSGLSYKQIPYIISIMGDPNRNIYGIKGTGKTRATNILRAAINQHLITIDTDNIDLVIPVIKPEHRKNIANNYRCTDIISQYKDCSNTDIYNITSQLKNKFNNVELRKLNDMYFNEYPIMLDALTSTPKDKKIVKF
jgi:hypothetical protein